MVDDKERSRPLTGGGDPPAGGDRLRDRLLAVEHLHAGCHGGQRRLLVRRRVGGDAQDVQPLAVEHLLKLLIDGGARARREALAPAGVAAAAGHQTHPLVAGEGREVGAVHAVHRLADRFGGHLVGAADHAQAGDAGPILLSRHALEASIRCDPAAAWRSRGRTASGARTLSENGHYSVRHTLGAVPKQRLDGSRERCVHGRGGRSPDCARHIRRSATRGRTARPW